MAYAQPNMQASEELAKLFSRNMTLQQPQPAQQASQPQLNQQQPESEPIKYSISQHYHHSAHTVHQDAPATDPQQRSFSEPPPTHPSPEQVLSRHGIDPLCLSPQQLDLFKTADTPQQIRLIELWQICPPKNSQQTSTAVVAWTNTSVEQEEVLAQLRHEEHMAEEARRNSVMSMDGTPLTPVQTTDGHWVSTAYVEPYMMSGYEMLARREYEESARRQLEEEMSKPKEDDYTKFGYVIDNSSYRLALDPAYASDWARQQQAMENQYGAYQQWDDMEL
ncbi:hypothetical protein O1611_g6137 [Lasiodiplodia mahajangana]|uniref:Uncharacterized protein n=1 Tax=Lasiodiplodia mahajangana TaxID=1108764 RepID=A0ACC2JJ66_9PEZI|nr:hypothetical protein O1611_g6137 [Lasiodiplodia mahajangana]